MSYKVYTRLSYIVDLLIIVDSLILTRENDVKQEEISLSKLDMVDHNILLLKPIA